MACFPVSRRSIHNRARERTAGWSPAGGVEMDELSRRGRRRALPVPGLGSPDSEPPPRRDERSRRRARDLPPEERAYREARRAAGLRLSFVTHLVPYTATCLFLLFVAGFRVAMIVALAWGIGVACHGFLAVVAPELRRRWIHDEVVRRVDVDVSRNRRELEGRHARSLEELSASIAHEIRNPITAAKSLVQQLGEDPGSGENVEYAKVALTELERVERSISHLLRFAREEELEIKEVHLADVIDSALESFRDRIERQGVTLACDTGAAGPVQGDPEKLRRVVINLVGNALDAVQGRPAPRLEIAAGENLAGSEAWLRVRDNGPGIEPARLERVWSPFHTSKPAGTGLGLAITRKLVEAHEGSIELDSRPGEGTEFVVRFPKRRGAGGRA
jgi:signal transduction histidine kinase